METRARVSDTCSVRRTAGWRTFVHVDGEEGVARWRTKKGGVANEGPGRKGVPKYRYTWSRPRRNTYLPTYLVRVLSHSLTPAVSPSFSCPRVRSLPSSHFPSSRPIEPHSSLGPAWAIPLEVHAMMHAIEQQRGPISGLFHLADDARCDVAVVLFLSFFSFSLPFSLLCYPVARACNFTERVHSSCPLTLGSRS